MSVDIILYYIMSFHRFLAGSAQVTAKLLALLATLPSRTLYHVFTKTGIVC